MSFKDEPPAELPGGGLCEGPSGRAVTECVQERGELWVLPVIPAGWRVGAAAGRAEELSEHSGFPCSKVDALTCEPPHATLLGGQCLVMSFPSALM